MKAEVGILAVKASWIIYFAMLLSSCSEIRVNQIADWMEKQEEVKFFFKYCKRQPHTVEQCIYHSLDIKYIVLCSTPVISAARQKCTFFVTTDACAVVPWGTLNVWAEIFYCWWKGFENCSSAMKCASNYLFIFPQLTLLDFPLFLLHLLWVWHNVFLFHLFIYFFSTRFQMNSFSQKCIENSMIQTLSLKLGHFHHIIPLVMHDHCLNWKVSAKWPWIYPKGVCW